MILSAIFLVTGCNSIGSNTKIVSFTSSDWHYLTPEPERNNGGAIAVIDDIPDGFIWYDCSCHSKLSQDMINKLPQEDGYFSTMISYNLNIGELYQNKDTKKFRYVQKCQDNRYEGTETTLVCIMAYK